MIRHIALLTLSLLFFLRLAAQSTPSLEAANQAYQNKEYEAAIQQYEEMLLANYHSEALYYNLGNAYYRNGELGKAILNYQRALQLDPNDEQALHNLEVAQEQLPEQVIRIQQSGVVKAWLSVQNALSTRSWSFVGLAFLWLGCGGIAVWLLNRNPRRRKWALTSGVLLIFLSLLPFLLAYGRSQQEFFSTRAVVMAEQTQLRAAPEPDSKEVQLLYEGSTVEVLDAIGAWNKVRLDDASEGWLPKDVLEGV